MDVVDIRHITIEASEVAKIIERELRQLGRIEPNQVLQSVKMIGQHGNDDWDLKLYFVERTDAT